MDIATRGLTGDPLRRTVERRGLPVERRSKLCNEACPAGSKMVKVASVSGYNLALADTNDDSYACILKPGYSTP